MVQDANKVSDVKYKNFVERCVRKKRCAKCQEMYEDCFCMGICGISAQNEE